MGLKETGYYVDWNKVAQSMVLTNILTNKQVMTRLHLVLIFRMSAAILLYSLHHSMERTWPLTCHVSLRRTITLHSVRE
jgi:hypothetical protein